jgi:hypothetical protein
MPDEDTGTPRSRRVVRGNPSLLDRYFEVMEFSDRMIQQSRQTMGQSRDLIKQSAIIVQRVRLQNDKARSS